MSKRANKYRAGSNPDMAAAMRDLRRSNAAGTHADKRSRRARTRFASKRRDIRLQGE